ncbi:MULTISPECIES: DUF2231 domain-containing protein [Actinokineospora]|uniref:DUF2231 domain-containing protein n=1 Tax=Actinokineospora fastidiosa TaxID=1816 RepID=A0A918GEE6_9PSEU|nr:MULTISPECIES: DUF2231 domain-containing protein [Actinokineospora]UVS79848.1 putative membrane protein [Actinokineospora sp. UTMC 2448]GGS31244.1 hypothetical protein GCM10010171_26390 [Actinokineospora fastidiosa]
MRSRVRAAGHAVHPMLMVFPLGLLVTAAVFDLLQRITGGSDWAIAAAYTMAAGVLGGLVAGLTGWADWALSVPKGTRARRVGLVHGAINSLVLALFALSWVLRLGEPGWAPGWTAVIVSWLGALLLGVGGWLGGELVERLSISVDEVAQPDATSSLSGHQQRFRAARA